MTSSPNIFQNMGHGCYVTLTAFQSLFDRTEFSEKFSKIFEVRHLHKIAHRFVKTQYFLMRFFLNETRGNCLKHIKNLDRTDLSFLVYKSETFSQIGTDRSPSPAWRWRPSWIYEAKFSGLVFRMLNFSLTSEWPDRPPKKPFSWRLKSSKYPKNRSVKSISPFTCVMEEGPSLEPTSEKTVEKPQK